MLVNIEGVISMVLMNWVVFCWKKWILRFLKVFMPDFYGLMILFSLFSRKITGYIKILENFNYFISQTKRFDQGNLKKGVTILTLQCIMSPSVKNLC